LVFLKNASAAHKVLAAVLTGEPVVPGGEFVGVI
jgi:hypothetical protein